MFSANASTMNGKPIRMCIIRARNLFFIFDKMLSIYVLYDMRKRPSSP